MLRISDIQIKEISNDNNPSDSGKSTKKKSQKAASQKQGTSSSKTKSKPVTKETYKIPKRKANIDSSSEGNFSLEDTIKQCFPNHSEKKVNKTPARNRLFFNKNSLPGKTYLPTKFAKNQRSISPVIEPDQNEEPIVMPSPPQRPQSSKKASAQRSVSSEQVTRPEPNQSSSFQPQSENETTSELHDARSLAQVMEENQRESQDSTNTECPQEISSDISELINEGIKNMTDSTPDISPMLSPMKQDRKVRLPDQSLILQGKRSRKQTEQFVAKSIESKSSEDNEPADAFSRHLLKQAEKQNRKADQKKKADEKNK